MRINNLDSDKNNRIVIDAGTTWAKILSIGVQEKFHKLFKDRLIKSEGNKFFYIVPSQDIKKYNFMFDFSTGHMAKNLVKKQEDSINEIIALSYGCRSIIDLTKEENSLILDLGSRDAKWVRFENGKFKDLDWNNSCASSTGATIEMLLNFYRVNNSELIFQKAKFNVTCGVFGLEKIMDDISSGNDPRVAISKFIHGIAYNTWIFAQKPKKIYLSGGFCNLNVFVDSLKTYCDVITLGRFVLCKGLLTLNM